MLILIESLLIDFEMHYQKFIKTQLKTSYEMKSVIVDDVSPKDLLLV